MNTTANILPVSHLLFQEREFKVYGTNENPLFLVNDIVCGLLEMGQTTDNQFFRDNRENQKYVNVWGFPICPEDIQLRLKHAKKDRVYFFTESGLYRCLMRSNKPIAELFQDEVV